MVLPASGPAAVAVIFAAVAVMFAAASSWHGTRRVYPGGTLTHFNAGVVACALGPSAAIFSAFAFLWFCWMQPVKVAPWHIHTLGCGASGTGFLIQSQGPFVVLSLGQQSAAVLHGWHVSRHCASAATASSSSSMASSTACVTCSQPAASVMKMLYT